MPRAGKAEPGARKGLRSLALVDRTVRSMSDPLSVAVTLPVGRLVRRTGALVSGDPG
ncbi:hypothetical protein GCM10009759_60140 [Kitasatospora saccharophila]|uniref:Uncharacterized protein n=1 Tax=Kitasatospora saccharophila TaxID=407973 RepID=A0ABN2XQ91_9ACTN